MMYPSKVARYAFLISITFLPLLAHGSGGVHITEVAFNPVGTDTGAEYVIITNSGSTSVALAGWDLYADSAGYLTFRERHLAAGGSITVHIKENGSDNDAHIYFSAAKSNMGNTSGSVALFTSTDHNKEHIVDFVQYGRTGETWESAASEVGLWIKGEVVPVTADMEGVLKRNSAAHSANTWEYAVSENSSDEGATEQEDVSHSADSHSLAETTPDASDAASSNFYADAGRDVITQVGASVQFDGVLRDQKKNTLDLPTVRYSWNFGDGSFQNSGVGTHAYLHPGVYVSELSITMGKERFTDKRKITVNSNGVFVSEVLPGPEGWIELQNNGSDDINISGWIMKSGDSSFIFPQGSILSGSSKTVIGAKHTKIAVPESVLAVSLIYGNGTEGGTWTYMGLVPNGNSVSFAGNVGSLSTPTPGKTNIVLKNEDAAENVITDKEILTQEGSEARVLASVAEETTDEASAEETEESQTLEKTSTEENTLASVTSSQNPSIKWLLYSIGVGILVGLAGLKVRPYVIRYFS